MQRKKAGGVSEWSKEHAWKVCKSKGFEGSNPSPSAKILQESPPRAGFLVYMIDTWRRPFRVSERACMKTLRQK